MTNTTGQIEIPLSKKKLILMLIGSIGFVAVGLWFVIKLPAISNPFFGTRQLFFYQELLPFYSSGFVLFI